MRRGIGSLVLLMFSVVASLPAQAQDATTLLARHAALKEPLADNPFQRPLVLESMQNSGDLKGDVYAVIDQPFAVSSPALQGMAHWCDILILHLNVKHCRASGAETLALRVGRKFDQPMADAFLLDFRYQLVAAQSDYLHVTLGAEEGPLGTSHYRLQLEAAPLDATHSFVHMSYAYDYGMAARLAMQGYLATIGRDKVGFSIVSRQAGGKPVYIGNVRGVVERNTMRYYLAIEAYLGALSLPPGEQAERRLSDWFSSVERYPLQLHELERGEYMEMKRRELRRQASGEKID